MDAYDRCNNWGKKKILPIVLPSMVEAENVSEHPRWRQCTSLYRWLEKIKHWSQARLRPLLLLQNLQQAIFILTPWLVLLDARSSQCPQTPWWHLQFQSMSSNALMTPSIPVNVLKRLDDTFSSPRLLSRLWDRRGPPLSSGSSFSSRALLFPNFNKIVEGELLIMVVQQPENIFSILLTNSRFKLTCWSCGQKKYVGGLLEESLR